MKKKMVLASIFILLITVVAAAITFRHFRGSLSGDNEVPVVSTEASGRFSAQVSNSGDSISYRLSYDELEGNVTQAHIHVGQKNVNGGISVWLCANPALLPPTTVIPPGTQACPTPPATIEGVITPTEVVGPVPQGIDAGEFDELLRAIREGNSYANVHSTRFPGGEVRSQLEPGRSRHDH
jgi:hypothetical protein